MIYLPYQKITSILKYACLSLLVYCIVPLYHDEIAIVDIIKASCIPTIQLFKRLFDDYSWYSRNHHITLSLFLASIR